jgi:hypothetical protein
MERAKLLLTKVLAYIVLAGFLFGILVVLTVPFELNRMVSAESWPARQGLVTLSYASRKSTTGRPAYWRPEVCGTYEDDGQRFCISRVSFGTFRLGDGEAEARAVSARYPVGSHTRVYYSPENPKDTILDPHPSWKPMLTLLAVGTTGFAMPFALWLLGRYRLGTSAVR